MILAAGRGERMRPLTDTCPKPLLQVGGTPLIVWHIRRMVAAGIRDIVINQAWLGHQITEVLGDGAALGASIRHSAETEALETAGGIAQALEWLGTAPFLVVNGDIWCDWDIRRAPLLGARLQALQWLSWCVLVDNPAHHPTGDFLLQSGRLVDPATSPAADRTALTFSGIGIYDPALFAGIVRGTRAPLAPLLRQSAAAGRAGAEHHPGRWTDVGTPQRLADLDASLRSSPSSNLSRSVHA
jgi:MurNAc alpha-1-phosphate uridylyltransferase